MKLILALVLAVGLSASCSLGDSEATSYPLPSVAITTWASRKAGRLETFTGKL